MDRLEGRDLLHEEWPDPEPRVACGEGFVSGLVKAVDLVTLDQDVFPLMDEEKGISPNNQQ